MLEFLALKKTLNFNENKEVNNYKLFHTNIL